MSPRGARRPGEYTPLGARHIAGGPAGGASRGKRPPRRGQADGRALWTPAIGFRRPSRPRRTAGRTGAEHPLGRQAPGGFPRRRRMGDTMAHARNYEPTWGLARDVSGAGSAGWGGGHPRTLPPGATLRRPGHRARPQGGKGDYSPFPRGRRGRCRRHRSSPGKERRGRRAPGFPVTLFFLSMWGFFLRGKVLRPRVSCPGGRPRAAAFAGQQPPRVTKLSPPGELVPGSRPLSPGYSPG